MVKTGAIGEALEVFQEEMEQGAATAKQQITGKPQASSAQASSQQQGTNAAKQAADQAKQAASAMGDLQGAALPPETPKVGPDGKIERTDELRSFLGDLYGGNSAELTEAEIKQKEMEDKQKEEALKQQLHSEYYQKLVTPPQQQAPRQAEKLEMEKKEEEEKKLEEEKKKPQELPVVMTKDMGTKEKMRGVSG